MVEAKKFEDWLLKFVEKPTTQEVPDKRDRVVFGNYSSFANWLSKPDLLSGTDPPNPLEYLISDQSDHFDRFSRCTLPNELDEISSQENAHRLRGLYNIFEYCVCGSGNEETLANFITNAIESFDKAWPDRRSNPDNGNGQLAPFDESLFNHSVSQIYGDEQSASNDPPRMALKNAFKEHGSKGRAIGVVIDLLRKYQGIPTSHHDTLVSNWTSSNIASTPVFLASKSYIETHGRVMWLTVELFKDCGSGFAPCPRTLGMMSLRDGETNEDLDNSFLTAMDKSWHLSRVAEQGYRGRWTLTHLPPRVFQYDASNKEYLLDDSPKKPSFLRSITGGSAEAAALIAILAASGMIPDDDPNNPDSKPFHLTDAAGISSGQYSALRLAGQIGITASLNTSSANNTMRVVDIELGSVLDCDLKLAGAQNYKLSTESETLLDTIIVSKVESTDNEEARLVKARIDAAELAQQQATDNNESFRGINFRKCKTVGEAINWMLTVNRFKDALNKKRCQDWEDKWEKLLIPIPPVTDSKGNVITPQSGEEQKLEAVSSGSLKYLRYVEENPDELHNPVFATPRVTEVDSESSSNEPSDDTPTG